MSKNRVRQIVAKELKSIYAKKIVAAEEAEVNAEAVIKFVKSQCNILGRMADYTDLGDFTTGEGLIESGRSKGKIGCTAHVYVKARSVEDYLTFGKFLSNAKSKMKIDLVDSNDPDDGMYLESQQDYEYTLTFNITVDPNTDKVEFYRS